eukprot:gene6412-4619_t
MGGAAVRRGHPLYETAEGAEFARARAGGFRRNARVSAAEFREAVVCAAADPCFGPLRHVAFEWAAADDCAGPRCAAVRRRRHAVQGQWHVFVQELGLRCFTYGPKEYAAAPSLAVHIAANELRCCDGGAAGALAVWRDAVVGILRRIHLAAGRLCVLPACRCPSVLRVVPGLMDAAGGAGAESRLERCGGGEPCPGADLAAGLTKTARDASKWLSRCDGSEMVCQMSRSQLRVFLARALQCLRLTCESCERDAPEEGVCRPSRGLLCGAAPLPPAGWGAEAVRAGVRPEREQQLGGYVGGRVVRPLRRSDSLAPACGAVYGLEGKASGSEAATRDLRAHFERWAARLRAQAFLFCFLDFVLFYIFVFSAAPLVP